MFDLQFLLALNSHGDLVAQGEGSWQGHCEHATVWVEPGTCHRSYPLLWDEAVLHRVLLILGEA